MASTGNVVEFDASVAGETTSEGLTYRAKVTAGPEALAGLFAYGDTPAAARRALADLVPAAFTAAGAPLESGAFVRMTVPEVYRFPAAG